MVGDLILRLGLRCLELLDGPGDQLRCHDDEDSIYTLSVMLTDHEDFIGGGFRIDRANSEDGDIKKRDIIELYPKQFGGVLFDSLSAHGVAKLASGHRTVFVIELWPFEDSSFDDYRPSLSKKMNYPKIPKLIRVPPSVDILVKSDKSSDIKPEDVNVEL